jgi:hypothetical protein
VWLLVQPRAKRASRGAHPVADILQRVGGTLIVRLGLAAAHSAVQGGCWRRRGREEVNFRAFWHAGARRDLWLGSNSLGSNSLLLPSQIRGMTNLRRVLGRLNAQCV